MIEWLTENWLFILFGAIFVGMHLTGRGCCGSHGRNNEGEGDDKHSSCSRSGLSKKETGNSCH